MAAAIPQVIHHHLYTETPPHKADGIKDIVSLAMVILGIAMIAGASIALAGHFFAAASAIGFEKIQAVFMMGLLSTIGGFHLSYGHSSLSLGFDAGPLAVTI